MQTKTIILNLINDNPGGLTLTEISQKTKLGENLSLIPTVAKRYVLELICNGLIQIDGKGGTYTITDKGFSELSKLTDIGIPMSDKMTEKVEKVVLADTPKTVTSRYAEMKTKLHNLSLKFKTT